MIKKVPSVSVKPQNANYFKAPVFAVAPMIDWTDLGSFLYI